MLQVFLLVERFSKLFGLIPELHVHNRHLLSFLADLFRLLVLVFDGLGDLGKFSSKLSGLLKHANLELGVREALEAKSY